MTRQLTHYCNRAPPKPLLDRYSELLEERLRCRFMTPLPFDDQMRAERERRISQSIRRKLRKARLILRMCDKGGGLYIGTKSDYERKAAEYRQSTKAYQELPANPLETIVANVTSALKDLKDKKQLSLYRYNLMMPKANSLKLPYMYFNPKVHKVNSSVKSNIDRLHTLFSRKEHRYGH